MVQQLTIFDALPTVAFAVGDAVEVVADVDKSQVEDYYYLKAYEGAVGIVVKVLSKSQCEVLFAKDNQIGIFRQCELRRG